MPARRGEIPEWAQRERVSDLEWIQENLHVLWPASRQGFEQSGRGAVVTDTTEAAVKHSGGEGHLMYYLTADRLFPIIDGTEVVRIKAAARSSNVNESYRFAFDIAFGDGQTTNGEPVLPLLQELVNYVTRVIDIFERYVLRSTT